MSRTSAEMIAWSILIGASMISIALAEIARSHDMALGKPILIAAWLVFIFAGIFFTVGLFVRSGDDYQDE